MSATYPQSPYHGCANLYPGQLKQVTGTVVNANIYATYTLLSYTKQSTLAGTAFTVQRLLNICVGLKSYV